MIEWQSLNSQPQHRPWRFNKQKHFRFANKYFRKLKKEPIINIKLSTWRDSWQTLFVFVKQNFGCWPTECGFWVAWLGVKILEKIDWFRRFQFKFDIWANQYDQPVYVPWNRLTAEMKTFLVYFRIFFPRFFVGTKRYSINRLIKKNAWKALINIAICELKKKFHSFNYKSSVSVTNESFRFCHNSQSHSLFPEHFHLKNFFSFSHSSLWALDVCIANTLNMHSWSQVYALALTLQRL